MTVAPYGTWTSPLSAQRAAAGAVRLRSVAIDADDVYWLEGRPDEGGRQVLVRRDGSGRVGDVTPAGSNVRTRVHEYGGGAYAVRRGLVCYSDFRDQRLYLVDRRPETAGQREDERRETGDGTAQPITEAGKWCYADIVVHPSRPWIVCVREDHSPTDREPINTLVAIAVEGPLAPGRVIASGHDFYSSPAFSPDGSKLAWLAWRHPNMPWDGTELWVADIGADGAIASSRMVAGGADESIFQPGWSPDGILYFVSDRTDWWNLYRLREGTIEAVCPMDAELGRPQWVFGTSTWAFADASHIVVSYGRDARWRLAVLDVRSGTLTDVRTDLEPTDNLAATATHAVFVGGSPRAAEAVVRVELVSGQTERIRTASSALLDPGYVSGPEAIEFPTENGRTSHAFYYPPCNADFSGPESERPPLIVLAHGGPTAATSDQFSPGVQYWTTRGFGVVDVNYGGSSGYGRAYRQRLNGRWGIVDVMDCINAAQFLVAQGMADPKRLAVRGGSAGGYVALAALTFHPEVFRAGASYYGIGDIEALVRTTHKFESRYFETLIGPYPAAQQLYHDRSPVHFVDRLSCALILFQGLEDKVVPPEQSRMMADAVRAKGLPVALIEYEGEQHGFRKADSIIRSLESELAFYGAVFGFTPAGPLPPIRIENLPARH